MKTLTIFFAAMLFTASTLYSQLNILPPVLTQPINNAVNIPLNPELRWTINLGLGTLLYNKLQIATDEGFNNIIHENLHINTNNLQLPLGILNPNGRYYWRVRAVINLGLVNIETGFSSPFSFTTTVTTGITQTGAGIPGAYKLYDNYPNPFNPSTNIKFDVKENTNVKLSVYSITGSLVSELVNANLSAGTYEASWDASGMASGFYFYSIQAGDYIATKKMVLTK